MRVLIWSDAIFPLAGGGELFTLKTKEALDAAGYTTHLLTVANGIVEPSRDITPVRSIRLNGVPLSSPLGIWQTIGKFQPEAALLIGPSANNVTVARFLGRVPIITHYLGDLAWSSSAGRLLHPIYFKWLLRRSKHVLTISQSVKRSLIAQGIESERITSTGVGSDVGLATASAIPSQNTVVFVGGLSRSHSYKRPDLLLRALPLLRDDAVTVTFIGGGNTDLLRALTDSLGIASRVRFTGRIEEREMLQTIRQSRLLVLPSPTAQEGFGIVAVEAMRLGVPVVVGHESGASELVERTGFGATWRGLDPHDLATAVDTVLAMTVDDRHSAFQRFLAVSHEYTWPNVFEITARTARATFG